MLLSVADARPRNTESVRARDLIPDSLQSNAKTFTDLIEEYYKFLNQDGLPSREIASIRTLKDIDKVSERYLEKIEELIGKSIPQSRVINKIELYKIIVKYYNTRGSEDSVHSFFKIFFNEFVSIFYPKDFLFNASSGLGYWSSRDVLNVDYDVLLRQQSDVIEVTLNGITFSCKTADGTGNVTSIRFKDLVEDQYDVFVDYYKGVTSVLPGEKSCLDITATDLFDGGTTYAIPDKLFFVGLGTDDKPNYSEQLPYVSIPFTGSPTRIEWNGDKWIFTIGSALGDLFAFYSEEDVADPSLVTTWIPGWYSAIGVPITGSIDLIEYGIPTNGQMFAALASDDAFTEDLTISADVLSADWTAEYETTDRFYLTENPLPLVDIPVGYLSVVNGRTFRPFVLGITSVVNDEFVWHKHFTESWVYENHRSFPSDEYKLFDGYYWQDYSYVIKSNLDAEDWLSAYKKFVHPAGLQLFSAIAIEMISRNEWNEPLDYSSTDLENDFTWLKALVPPARLDANSIGYHTPKYQPGYLRDKVFRYIFTYLLPEIHDETLLRLLILNYRLALGPNDVQSSFVRRQYQATEKFIDPGQIGAGWLNKTIEEAEEDYVYTNSCRIHNISIFFREDTIYDYSFYDTELGEGDSIWESSFFDTESGEGSGVWSSSSYEDL